MTTFQCTYQWTRRFFRGREGATLCHHNQVVSATKMKTGSDYVVPLSRQALTILRSVHKLTGDRRYAFSCSKVRRYQTTRSTSACALNYPSQHSDRYGVDALATPKSVKSAAS
jgi:hypothetical protein